MITMIAPTDPTTQNRTYAVLEMTTPITLTLIDGSVFTARMYSLTTTIVTAVGIWMGGKRTETTILVPLTSIQSIDMTSTEIPENEVPQEFKESVRLQKKRMGVSDAEG